jgi:hypothetical protein
MQTKNVLEPTESGNSGWLRRLFRRLVVMLFGEHNPINLNNENAASKQIEAYAKERGLPVITLRRVGHSAIHIISALDGAVYPLTNAKQKHTKESDESVSLWNKIKLKCKTRNHAARAQNREGVPPVTNLKAGEWITHIVINAKSPNVES